MRPRLIRPSIGLHRRVVPRRWAHSIAPQLTSPTVDDIAHFARFLPQNAIITTLKDGESKESEALDELEQYNADWMGKYRGQSRVVLRPKSVQEVSKIMKHCWERRIGVVPQGGNTGLVGASTS
jgi:(R)-2-hydroxyglutarate---pyruvate transhydrogenase